MDRLCKLNNFWISHGVGIAVQVTMVFTFLTLFFFAYVVRVERQEFQKQLSIIVDSLLDHPDVQQLVNEKTASLPVTKEQAEILVLGFIDVTERKKQNAEAQADLLVTEMNDRVRNRANKALIIGWGLLLFGIIMLYNVGICTPLFQVTKESLLIVFFVGLTELGFLTFIASKYITASPNQVKRTIAQSIQQWIADNGLANTTR